LAHFIQSFTKHCVDLSGVALSIFINVKITFRLLLLSLLWVDVIGQHIHGLPGPENSTRPSLALRGGEHPGVPAKMATFNFNLAAVQSDSALASANGAIKQATSAQDQRSLFRAAQVSARLALQSSKADEGYKHYQFAIRIANHLNDDTLKAIAYRGAGQALWYQGNFQKALDFLKLSIRYSEQLKDEEAVTDATMVMGYIYKDQGNYEAAFGASLNALKMSEKFGYQDNTVLSLAQLGDLYRSIGDHGTALDFYRRGFSYEPDKGSWCYRHLSNSTGDLYTDMANFDSAYLYYKQGLVGDPSSKTSRWRLAEYYLKRRSYDSALTHFKELYVELNTTGERNILFHTLLGMGNIYLAKGDLPLAMKCAKRVLQFAEQNGTKEVLRDASKLVAGIHEKLQQPDSALFYYQRYVSIKDSIVTGQLKGKLYAFSVAKQDEEELEQLELLKRQKAMNRFFTNILIGVIVLLALLILFFVRNSKLKRNNLKLQNDTVHAEWQRHAGELEMQALRAQMNPHFIFNCLSSINNFIVKNETDTASDYLTRFSRLIRLVLLNSQKSLIHLEDEIEMLRLYLEMEKLRFKNLFNYSIRYTHEIEPSNIYIPPLLLQPFCENAIWHGLMHKDGVGELEIFISKQGEMVVCTITDNGIGREKAADLKTKSAEKLKSLGLKLTAKRLALFNTGNSGEIFYRMEDVIQDGAIAGTCVTVSIKHQQDIQIATQPNS
jgi:tetratricopeptide (TPR) repeat protein